MIITTKPQNRIGKYLGPCVAINPHDPNSETPHEPGYPNGGQSFGTGHHAEVLWGAYLEDHGT